MDVIEEFTKIIEISHELMGENGCLWDRKQTFDTLKRYLLEESYEVLDAVDARDPHNLEEELGDLFYIIIFFAKVAEKEGHFTLAEVIATVRNKLIYRHPHVFGEGKLETEEAIKEQWEALKKKEKSDRVSKVDGIPKALPALIRAEKIAAFVDAQEGEQLDEALLGALIFDLVCRAKKQKLNPELALAKELQRQEQLIRAAEKGTL